MRLSLVKLKKDYQLQLENCFFDIIKDCDVIRHDENGTKRLKWISKTDSMTRFHFNDFQRKVHPSDYVCFLFTLIFNMTQAEIDKFIRYMFISYMNFDELYDAVKFN